MTTPALTKTVGTLQGARLIHRLQQMADGVKKHGSEAGFPGFFTTNDVQVVHDSVSGAILTAKATAADRRARQLALKPQVAQMRELYQRAVGAIESFFGVASVTLREFGLRPRKGEDSVHTKQVRNASKARRKKKAAAAAKGGGK